MSQPSHIIFFSRIYSSTVEIGRKRYAYQSHSREAKHRKSEGLHTVRFVCSVIE